MPNWCHNILVIRGAPPEVAAFAAQARPTRAWAERLYEADSDPRRPPFEEWFDDWQRRNPLSFNSFVPHPPEGQAGRDWRDENWGTKWDAAFSVNGILSRDDADPEASLIANGVVVTDEVLVYKFQTAWLPPEAAVTAMAEQHPTLELILRFAEYGNDYAGELQFANGELVDREELDPDAAFASEERWF